MIGDDADRRNWLHDIAAFLKKIDPNHLVIDGRNKPIDIHGKYDEFLDDENIDAVSYHTYVNLPEADTTVGTMRLIHEQLHERKVLLISEIAMYTSTKVLRDLFEEMIELNIPGANWWGLRFHNRDGGFYKHSDRGSKYEDLNWPGFSSAESAANSPDLAHEHDVLALLSEYAARINGRSPAPTAVPATPVMLPAADVGHLSWQGSTGANGYDVQRAPTSEGPWITIAANVGDHLAPYDALFYDGSAALNTDLFYRVIARNSAGASAPSDALGPLRTDRFWIVDDQLDATKWGASSENLKIVHTYLHSGNIEGVDVAQRTDPTAPGRLHYRVPGTLRSFHVFAYATAVPPRFYVINAAGERHNALPTPTAFQDDRRTRYDLTLDRSDAVGLEIELPANASASQAIGRVELTWVPIP